MQEIVLTENMKSNALRIWSNSSRETIEMDLRMAEQDREPTKNTPYLIAALRWILANR